MIDISITKSFKDFELDISFKSDKKLIAIIGKSGSGKTTLLRCIAGFEKCKGSIKIDNEEWINLEIQKRNFGIVFQNYALFDNMNVFQNLLFAKKDIKKIKYLINLLELTGLENRYPKNLSGGEKQRVALARALMNEPKILLLDEPFSALNYELKEKLYKEIELIKKNFNIQIILISHDISEVYRLADDIIEIDNGKVIKKGQVNFTKNAKVIKKDKAEIIIEYKGEIIKINL